MGHTERCGAWRILKTISKPGLLVAERNHDPNITDKKKARVNSGIKEAKAFIDLSWRIADKGDVLNGKH